MRILLMTASAVALSGCSWLGHMSNDDFYQYGQNTYTGGSSACGHVAPRPVQQPVPVTCRSQARSFQQPAYTVQQPQTYAQPQTYVQSQPSFQSQPQYSGQSFPVAPVQNTAQNTVQNYEQQYTQSQPVYTTGNYGTQADPSYGSGYSVPASAPLRGSYGLPKKPRAKRFYVSGYGGANFQHESENRGLAQAFTTGDIGNGTTLTFADNTEYAWETDYDVGYVYGGEVGFKTQKGWRFGLEGTRSVANVDSHEDVFLAGTEISALDAATLTGSPTALGVSVGDTLAVGEGEIEQYGAFLNGYYDFNKGGRFRPYVGVGVGLVDVEVEYNPSGVGIIDGSDTVFGYQGRIGASYTVKGPLDVFTEYTYRATDGVNVQNDLFAGTLEVENDQSLVTAGLRYNF